METTIREKSTGTPALFLSGLFMPGFHIGTGCVMDEQNPSLTTNILLTAISIFSIVTSSMGIKGVWQLISG
jgi:hypothetical protein